MIPDSVKWHPVFYCDMITEPEVNTPYNKKIRKSRRISNDKKEV